MRRGIQLLFAFLLVTGVAGPASALTFDLDVRELNREMVGGEDIITFGAFFVPAATPAEQIVGFDVTISWDTNEVALNSYTNIFGGLGRAPSDTEPNGSRASTVDFTAKDAGALFQISFVVENPVSDGVLDDFRVFIGAANGSGIGSPVGLSHDVSNPEGFAFDIVPEPSTLALLAATLAPLALRRRR